MLDSTVRIRCQIWWDVQSPDDQGWCVVWTTIDDDGNHEHANDTVDAARRCGLTTLRRRAWRGVQRGSLIARARRAFATARWEWHNVDGGYWESTVRVPY